MNTNMSLRADPITEANNQLAKYIENKQKSAGPGSGIDNNESDSDDDIRPFKGFAKPLDQYKTTDKEEDDISTENRLLSLINEHVEEALKSGFDDSIAKFKGKSHFVVCDDQFLPMIITRKFEI